MYRAVRFLLTVFLVFSLTFDTASGCWRTRKSRCCRPCVPVCSVCVPTCEPVTCQPPCPPISGDMTNSIFVPSEVITEAPTEVPTEAPTPAAVDPVDSSASSDPAEVADPPVLERPAPIEPAIAEEPVVELTPETTPTDEPPTELAPFDPAPSTDQPTVTDPIPELPPAESAAAPAEVPAELAPTPEGEADVTGDLGDLFGDPVEEPSELQPADESSSVDGESANTEPAGDLFDEPNDAPSSPVDDPEPVTPDSALPVDEAEPTEDLFGETTESATEDPTDEMPEPAPESSDDATDLFDEPADDLAPAEDPQPAEDPAPAEESEPTGEDPAPSDGSDSIFDLDLPDEQPEDGGLDDPFGRVVPVTETPGGLDSNSLRHWTDNTGSYTIRGRLIKLLNGKVKLVKENGRTTTVPLGRLSQSDLVFVRQQAGAVGFALAME